MGLFCPVTETLGMGAGLEKVSQVYVIKTRIPAWLTLWGPENLV